MRLSYMGPGPHGSTANRKQHDRISGAKDSRNGRRNETHEGSRSLLFVLCIIATLMTLHRSSAEEAEKCKQRCWKKALSQDISFTDGLYETGIDNEKACKDLCAGSDQCVGIYWGFNQVKNTINCWLQMPNNGTSDKLTKANHWVFNKCTDDCLAYCWKPKSDNVQTSGGTYQAAPETEEECKKLCANDPLCDGADWEIPKTECWLISTHIKTPFNITHWEIVRDTLTKCTKAEQQCMPHCWSKSVSPVLTFNDGVFKKTIDNERNCKDMCASNQTCIGVYWGFNTVLNIVGCFLQMPFQVVSESLKDVNHWKLSNCTDDCLPYCWLPKTENMHMLGGVLQVGMNDESVCKMTCVNAEKCFGVDFNHSDSTCWLLYESHLMQNPVKEETHHWEIQRNLPEVCSNESSVLTTGSDKSLNTTVEIGTTPTPAPAPVEAVAAETAAPVEAENKTETPGGSETTKATDAVGPKGGGADTGESAFKIAGPKRILECPNYILGIVVLSGLMGVSVLIIIALISFIIARTIREQQKNG